MSIAAPLLAWFAVHGRSSLPWRTTRDPYRTVVSEFMLQQTQVDRVVPLFEAFVARWPDFAALAAASQADVVRAWRGLGYNSRAVRLHQLATCVCERFGGTLPRDEATLRALPGVGPYTARAIAAFAFDAGVAALDTNVRRIVHRTQLGLEWPPAANAARLDGLAATLVPRDHGYAFNSAMMDLGATICLARAPKCPICPLAGTCAAAPVDPGRLASLAKTHAKPRSPGERTPFESSARYLRGRVVDRLRALGPGERISLLDLRSDLAPALARFEPEALEAAVTGLTRENVVTRTGSEVALRS